MASCATLLRKSLQVAKRVLEELFPFFFFFCYAMRKLQEAANPDIGASDGEYSRYHDLNSKTLSLRIKEEHERAKAIDEKTVKFTFSISIALTMLGATGGYFTTALQSGVFKFVVSGVAGTSVFYTLMGGLLALGALKTFPTYGYGTDFLLSARKNKQAKVRALAAQEKINIVRQMRNEAAYQCLRNGFFALLISATVFVIALSLVPKD